MTLSRRIFLGLALALLAVSAFMQVRTGNASDKNWLLEAAYKWVQGGRLYTDIFEVNPPLIIWLYAIPEWLAPRLSMSDVTLLALMGLGLSALSTWLCVRLIRLHPAFAGNISRQTDFALLIAYVLIFFTAPMYFADREHLFFTLTLPYIVRFCPGLAREKSSMRLRCAVGLLAAAGFCIKPHTAVVFLAVQLLYMVRQRSLAILWSVENIIISLAAGLYIASILLFLPEYVHTVLPMALETYSAYSRKLSGISCIVIFVVMAGVTFVDFRFRHKTPYRKDVYYFIGLCGACLLYALLNNGWAYTYLPLLSIIRFLSGWVFFEFLWLKRDAEAKGEPSRPFLFGLLSTGSNLVLNVAFYAICFAAFFQPIDCERSVACRSSRLFLQKAKAYRVHSFGSMSLGFYKWPELARETHEQWDTRFNHLWMLPKFVLSGPEFKEQQAWIITYVGKAYAEDLNNHKPDIIYVDISPNLIHGHPNIDIPGYFGGVPEFQEAWSHYRRTETIDACLRPLKGQRDEVPLLIDCRFDIYSRIAKPAK